MFILTTVPNKVFTTVPKFAIAPRCAPEVHSEQAVKKLKMAPAEVNKCDSDEKKDIDYCPPYTMVPYSTLGGIKRIFFMVQLPGGDASWDLRITNGGNSLKLVSKVDDLFYSPKVAVDATLGSFNDPAILPAYDSYLKELRGGTSTSKKVEYCCIIDFPYKVQEKPKEIAPIVSKDHNYILVALFEEPTSAYEDIQKKKALRLE